MSKQITVFGLAIKQGGRHARDYAGVELVYEVEDNVTVEDAHYYLSQHGDRIAPVDPDTGEKLDGVIAINNEPERTPGGKPLGRIAFGKQLGKDLNNLDWKSPADKGHQHHPRKSERHNMRLGA